MELVHLNDSVKREGTNGNGSETDSDKRVNLKPIKVNLKDLNLEYVFHNASDVARGRFPRFFGGVLVNCDTVAFGTLDQDTIKEIKARYVNSDLDEFVEKKQYFCTDLETLKLGTIRGSKISVCGDDLEVPKKSRILDEVYSDMLKDTDPIIAADSRRIPLTPFNYWDIYNMSNVKFQPDSVDVKLAKGAKLVTGYDNMVSVTTAIHCYQTEKNSMMDRFKLYIYDEHIQMLVRLLLIDYEVDVTDNIIQFSRRALPNYITLEMRTLFLEPIRRKFLDKIAEDFNNSCVYRSRSKSRLALVYAWIVDNNIMTDDLKLFMELIQTIKVNFFERTVQRYCPLMLEEVFVAVVENLANLQSLKDYHMCGKVYGVPHRDIAYGRADEEIFRIEYALDILERIGWKNRTNNICVSGHLGHPLIDSMQRFRRYYGGGNFFRYSKMLKLLTPFVTKDQKGTFTYVLLNDAVIDLMENNNLERLVRELDEREKNYVLLFEISSVKCMETRILLDVWNLNKRTTVIYPDGPHFITWVIVYSEPCDFLESGGERTLTMSALYKMLVEFNTLWYCGIPHKSSLFIGANKHITHVSLYFFAKKAFRQFSLYLKEAFLECSEISAQGANMREYLMMKKYERRGEKTEDKQLKKKNS